MPETTEKKEHIFNNGASSCWCGKYHYTCARCGVDCTMGAIGGPGIGYPHPDKPYLCENFVHFCYMCDRTVKEHGLVTVLRQMSVPGLKSDTINAELQVDIRDIVSLVTSGLCTDGGHHKQWYLEEILRKIVVEEEFERLKNDEDYGWEEGIIP